MIVELVLGPGTKGCFLIQAESSPWCSPGKGNQDVEVKTMCLKPIKHQSMVLVDGRSRSDLKEDSLIEESGFGVKT